MQQVRELVERKSIMPDVQDRERIQFSDEALEFTVKGNFIFSETARPHLEIELEIVFMPTNAI
jgi:hypothetical protein